MPAKPKHPMLKAAEKILAILESLPADQAEKVMKLIDDLWEDHGTTESEPPTKKSSGSDVTNF